MGIEGALSRQVVALTWLHCGQEPEVWHPTQTAAVRTEPQWGNLLSCQAASSWPGLGFIRVSHLFYKAFHSEALAFPIHSLYFYV